MKNQLLLAFFAVLSFSAVSQFSRSFYTAENNNRPVSSLVSLVGQKTVVSINGSGNDTLRVMLIDIDERGETSNYRSFSYASFQLSTSYVLSGAGVNSLGEITLNVSSQNGSENVNLSFIKLNPNTGAFSNYTFLIGQYRKGYSRSRVKGDSLITYLTGSSGQGLIRLSRSISNTGVSLEIASPTLGYNSSMSSGFPNIACELMIDGNDEYIAVQNTIVKRIGADNYINTSNLAPFSQPCMAVTSTGELFVLNRSGNTFKRFDANFNLLSSGTIIGLQSSPTTGKMEIYALPNNAVRVWLAAGVSTTVLDIDATNTITERHTSRNFPLDQYMLDGKQYIIGFDPVFISPNDIDGNAFQSSGNALTVVQDDLSSSIPEFIEYGQVLSTDKIEFFTGHNGWSFQFPTSTAGFNFKQNNLSRGLIYAAEQTIVGQDANGGLLGVAHYGQNGRVTGPYTPVGNYSYEQMDQFNRGYFVTRDMINAHVLEITAGNPTYVIPFGIRQWPAHGDVSLGQAANLAGFFDQNSNGIYEPEQGDYPTIYGDQCLLNIYHQHPNVPDGASIETHQYYFTFDCNQEEAIENTVFVRTHNFARTQPLFDAYVGNYFDFDIGGAPDDYCGSNVELGMIYGYNGDLLDQSANGVAGFQDTIPAVGLLTLQGAKLDPNGSDNAFGVGANESINGMGFADGIADNEYYTQESAYLYGSQAPGQSTLTSSYNILQGLNPDGSPKQINGVTIRHDYFGTSDPLFYSSNGVDHGNNYSEDGGFNPSGDRRMFAGSGSMTFNTVDTLILLDAFVVGVDTVNLSPANSVARLFQHGQTLRDFFVQNTSACGNNFDPYISDFILSTATENLEQLVLYPNPASSSFRINGIAGQAEVSVFDLNGRMVLNATKFSDGDEFSIEALDNAVYLITVEDENGKHVIRLVKR